MLGATLALALAYAPVSAAIITVADGEVAISDNGICSLVEAIDNANDTVDGNVHDDCAAGDPAGADTITLPAAGLFTLSYDYYAYTGLPPISSEITIEGNGAIIEGDSGVTELRHLFVSPTGDLTVNETTLRDGFGGGGGAAFVNQGELTLNNCTITNNGVYENSGHGGAILNLSGTVAINNSELSYNSAYRGSAVFNSEYSYGYGGGITTITDSTLSGGGLYSSGSAVHNAIGTVTISNSTLSGYSADRGGAVYNYNGTTTIISSTLSDNTVGALGGGVYNASYGTMTITNSTLSGNYAGNSGGGLFNDGGTVTITNSTLTDNISNPYYSYSGGGVFNNSGGTLTFNRSLVSGNSATYGAEVYHSGDTLAADNYNLFGHSGISTTDALYGFSPGASDITATSDGTDPTPLAAILDPLADNGGPTVTHALPPDSPALDAAPTGPADDQRAEPRPGGAAFDIGAYELQPPGAAVFMSAKTPGTTGDGLDFGPEDVIRWDGDEWSLWFDGSAAGLMPMNAKHNVNALWIPDPDEADVVLSFAQNARVIPGIGPKVDRMDLVWWDGDAFSLYFDGSDVGLTVKTAEKIDGLHILPGEDSPIGGSCDAYLLISTQGTGKVPNHSGGTLNFRGEDVLGFCLTDSGANTSGLWHMALDGSTQGMPPNSTESISLSDDGNTLYLTTKGTFNVDSAAGSHSMVYAFDFGSGEFSGPVFSAPANGLDKKVDGLQVEGELP